MRKYDKAEPKGLTVGDFIWIVVGLVMLCALVAKEYWP